MQYGHRRWPAGKGAFALAAGLFWMFIFFVPLTRAAEMAPDAVYGIWATSGTMIEVMPRGEGGLSAKIVALKHPLWREKDGIGVVGEPKMDLHNPDASLHARPFIGLEMLEGYQFRKGKWRGRLYLPSNGSNWKSSAHVKNGELRLRGFIGVSLLGKTQKFTPIDSCNENILRMIRIAELKGTPCADKLENVQ